jgi:hypothetical protein
VATGCNEESIVPNYGPFVQKNNSNYLKKELAKKTPISQLLASYDNLDYQSLESFLNPCTVLPRG